MNEFDLIATYLAPLAGEGAFGLKDDVALHHGMAMSKDVLVDGVHFRAEDGWDFAARKCLRVNISDVIAKGAKPQGVFLGLVWPANVTEQQIAQFCQGLAEDLKAYKLKLLGGDTTRHVMAGAPLTVSVTITGLPGVKGTVLRSGAKPGDIVFVTGTIGDGWLGLHTQRTCPAEFPKSVEIYLSPKPPFALIDVIGQFASSAIDISDGLVADANHLAQESNVSLRLAAEDIPLSTEAREWYAADGELAPLVTGGDDYQTLLTVPASRAEEFQQAAKIAGVAVTAIGEVMEGDPVVDVLMADGSPLALNSYGYSHF